MGSRRIYSNEERLLVMGACTKSERLTEREQALILHAYDALPMAPGKGAKGLRKEAGTLRMLARHWGVSVKYISHLSRKRCNTQQGV